MFRDIFNYGWISKYFMKTFGEFLEGLYTFNSRDPDYDLNLAGDYSDDHDDMSHFLLPFAKKIKAYYWWVASIARSLQGINSQAWWSREQNDEDPEYRQLARFTALRLTAGINASNANVHKAPYDFSGYMERLAGTFQDIYKGVTDVLKGVYSAGLIKKCQNAVLLMKKIDADIEVPDEETGLNAQRVEKIKENLGVILNFVEKSIPQLQRISTLGNPGRHRPTDIMGRRSK